jgi:hypothetical protein
MPESLDHARVGGQPEVVVAAEGEQRLAIDRDAWTLRAPERLALSVKSLLATREELRIERVEATTHAPQAQACTAS